MKALKTIVATAVIVFALTTVAMAGVQHFTKQGSQTTGSQTQAAQPTYTVTLTAVQLAQLMNGSRAATTGGVHHARHAQRHATKARHHASTHYSGDATHPTASGSGGMHHYETTHHSSSSTSGSGSHHVEAGHDSGEGHDGGSCGE